jgi:hypothetical protein
MRRTLIIVAAGLLLAHGAIAQEAQSGNAAKEKTASSETTAPKPKLTQEELEARFKETLSNAILSGRWCVVNNGKLGAEKEDKYTIVGVSKLKDDRWLLRARIQYGKVDVIAPIPLQVKWAGDTPVLIVDNFGFGEGAKYSARILIYEKSYAGTWSGGDHGGLMNGIITPLPQTEKSGDSEAAK